MKTLITKKLFAFIITLMMFSFNDAVAQIISTDVNPDITESCFQGSCSKSYLLDLNNDGITDFNLNVSSSLAAAGCESNHNITLTPLNTNAVSGLKLALKTAIDGNTAWSTTVQSLRSTKVVGRQCFETYSGDWSDSTDGYLALKIIVNNEVYFGWAHFKVYSQAVPFSFTIMDYAYNSTPNQPIGAGDDEVLSTKNFTRNSSFKVYPNPFSDATNIAFTLNQSEKVSMRIIDLNGRLIKNLVNGELEAGDHLIQCTTENINTGIYFLQIQAGESLKTEKLIITK